MPGWASEAPYPPAGARFPHRHAPHEALIPSRVRSLTGSLARFLTRFLTRSLPRSLTPAREVSRSAVGLRRIREPPDVRDDGRMAGFSGFDPVIRRYGGIASRRELLAAGWSETDFWFALYYGNLDRIRQGWYASSDLADDARAAWRAGGPLACVSALIHHGMLDVSAMPDASSMPDASATTNESALHICLPHDGHVPKGAPAEVVVHWSTADHVSGTRRAVSPQVALRQARVCRRAP